MSEKGFHIGGDWWVERLPGGFVKLRWRDGGGTTHPLALYDVHQGILFTPETWESVVRYIAALSDEGGDDGVNV